MMSQGQRKEEKSNFSQSGVRKSTKMLKIIAMAVRNSNSRGGGGPGEGVREMAKRVRRRN